MKDYWIVVDDKKGPIALVKGAREKVHVLAGDNRASLGFKNGRPNTLIDQPWFFEHLLAEPYFQIIGDWIDKLGPVKTADMRLKEEKEAEAKRQRVRNLTTQDKSNIIELRERGVIVRRIAERYGVGISSIRRIVEKKAA